MLMLAWGVYTWAWLFAVPGEGHTCCSRCLSHKPSKAEGSCMQCAMVLLTLVLVLG